MKFRKIKTRINMKNRKCDSISVVTPHDFGSEEIQETIKNVMLTKGIMRKKFLERIKSKKIVWMPYYHIMYDYYFSINEMEETRSAETAMNAMYYDETGGLEFQLFRPNYLEYTRSNYVPEDEDILGPIFDIDIQKTLNELVRILEEEKRKASKNNKELLNLQSKRRFFLPITRSEMDKSSQLSETITQSRIVEFTIRMNLNIAEEKIKSLKLKNCNIFYFPTLIVALEQKMDKSKRYLIFNLANKNSNSKSPKLDKVLSKACNKNKKFRKITRKLLKSGK